MMITPLTRTIDNLRAMNRQFYTVQFRENHQLKKTVIHTEDNKVATYNAEGQLIHICSEI